MFKPTEYIRRLFYMQFIESDLSVFCEGIFREEFLPAEFFVQVIVLCEKVKPPSRRLLYIAKEQKRWYNQGKNTDY